MDEGTAEVGDRGEYRKAAGAIAEAVTVRNGNCRRRVSHLADWQLRAGRASGLGLTLQSRTGRGHTDS